MWISKMTSFSWIQKRFRNNENKKAGEGTGWADLKRIEGRMECSSDLGF